MPVTRIKRKKFFLKKTPSLRHKVYISFSIRLFVLYICIYLPKWIVVERVWGRVSVDIAGDIIYLQYCRRPGVGQPLSDDRVIGGIIYARAVRRAYRVILKY